jgi:anaerobic dimethyl sulfoxide reductase subunit B (iron-sulfur subunit)
MACKNWNELRRDDKFNVLNIENYKTVLGGTEKSSTYIDPATGANNYGEFRKYYMKEDWRRVETYDKGSVVLSEKNTFKSTFDRRYLSVSCNHCEEPACVKICPQRLIVKESSTGAVLTAYDSCISCGRCKEACPWDAPQFYDDKYAGYAISDYKRPKMTKCTLCYDRINLGLKPACVAACWNRALDAGPMDELKERYQEHYVESLDEFADSAVPLLDISSTKPNVIFKKK